MECFGRMATFLTKNCLNLQKRILTFYAPHFLKRLEWKILEVNYG
jgi:hypothetical protein